jgi:hypothetical protein
MPQFNADTFNTQNTAELRARLKSSVAFGDVKILRATYTATGTEVAADTFAICKLPVGAVVVPHDCRYAFAAMGGTGTALASLGDTGSASRYSSTSVAVTSAGTSAVTPTNAIALTPYEIEAGNETILVTLALSSGTMTAGQKITFWIAYIMP